MRHLVQRLVLAAALAAPAVAHAGSLVPGMSRVEVEAGGDDGTAIRVIFTVAGPQTGPLKVGLARGKRLTHAVTVPLDVLPRGQYRDFSARIALDRDNPKGPYTLAVDGPHRRVGQWKTRIIQGPDQVVMVGNDRQVTHNWYEARNGDLGYAWADTRDGHLAVELFLRLHHLGETASVTFRRGHTVVCRDEVSPVGLKGQVVDFRATCRGPKADGGGSGDGDSGGGIKVVDDSNVYQDAASDSNATAGDVAGAGVGDPLPLAQVKAKTGAWRVEVRTGKRVRAVLSFRVTAKGIDGGVRRPGPMTAVRVRWVHR